MSWIPLINDEPYTFTTSDLSALIHGEEHSGASLFTMSLLSQLYFQGEPLILVTASPQTKEEFLTQTCGNKDFISVTHEENVSQAEEKQVIHLLKDAEALLPKLLKILEDKTQRIVLLKNIELLSPQTLALFYDHPLTIFSGNLNTCSEKEPLLQLKYNAKIFFSPLHNDFRLTLPPLEKYHGYYQGKLSQGIVSLLQ